MPADRTRRSSPVPWGHPRYPRLFRAICSETNTTRRHSFNELIDHHPTLNTAAYLYDASLALDRTATRLRDIARDANAAADDARDHASRFRTIATNLAFNDGNAEAVLRELELRLDHDEAGTPTVTVSDDHASYRTPSPAPPYSPSPSVLNYIDDIAIFSNEPRPWLYCATCDAIREPHHLDRCYIDLTHEDGEPS